jgi:hypothetical protein
MCNQALAKVLTEHPSHTLTVTLELCRFPIVDARWEGNRLSAGNKMVETPRPLLKAGFMIEKERIQ